MVDRSGLIVIFRANTIEKTPSFKEINESSVSGVRTAVSPTVSVSLLPYVRSLNSRSSASIPDLLLLFETTPCFFMDSEKLWFVEVVLQTRCILESFLELLPNVQSSCFLMRSSYHRPICMSTDNMCIFYTFIPFYKFEMQYLYSFAKSFSIVSCTKVPISYYLCYFSHYIVYQIYFRNTYCVTDDIRYRGHKIFRPQELAPIWAKDLVTRPDRSIKVG